MTTPSRRRRLEAGRRTPRPPLTRLIRLGSIAGVPIYFTPSWIVLTAFVTVAFAGQVRGQVAGISSSGSYLISLGYSLALAASVVLHEVAHTVTSRALGIPVRRIVIFLLGGLSEIDGEPERPRDEFSIAAAGPAASLFLGFAALAAAQASATGSSVTYLLNLLAWSNLSIAVFNLLPGLPLDGGRIVQAIFWKVHANRMRAIRMACIAGRAVALLLALASLAAGAAAGGSSHSGLAQVTFVAAGFAVSAFIFVGAGQSLSAAQASNRARDVSLQALTRRAVYVPAQMPLSEALHRTRELAAGAIVIIDAQQRCRAIVAESAVRAVTEQQRPWITAAELGVTLTSGQILTDDLRGQALLDAVAAHPSSHYLVIGADGASRGVLDTYDLRQALAP